MLECRHQFIGTVGWMGGIMSVPTPFCDSLADLMVHSHEALCQPNEHIYKDRARFSLHDWGRNELVARMKGDWILMLDTDIEFPPDTLSRLVMLSGKYRVEVLTGVYASKMPPHYPVLWLTNKQTGRREQIADWNAVNAPECPELIPIDDAGAGCLFIRRTVFERIATELKESPFARIGTRGEDFSFFTRLKRVGIQAYCAWKVECSHLEYVGLTPSSSIGPPDPVTTIVHEHERTFQLAPQAAAERERVNV